MADRPSYAILGRGRWGTRVRAMLEAQSRRCVAVEQVRRREGERADHYAIRMGEELRAAGVEFAWLSLPPGDHVPLLVRAALDAGLHVIAEKPWSYSREESDVVLAARVAGGRLVAIDFEYCLLDGVRLWRSKYGDTDGLVFGGRFVVQGPDRLGIAAMDNLGSHLLAIREYATPRAAIGEIRCAYLGSPERRIWLDGPGGRVAEIDFAASPEPILQRFVAAVEQARDAGEVAFDIPFAQRVAASVERLMQRNPS